MRLIIFILRSFFHLLYHQFAWAYDFIASVVSLGRWQSWVAASLPYLQGKVLEIGFGPGHLQELLAKKGFKVVGLDESKQMALQARQRLQKQGVIADIIRGYAQNIPFTGRSFDSVIATFPSEYIFDPRTLNEILRVLTPTGKLIILPTAWITGSRPLERLAAWLFRVTGEAPDKPGLISAAVRSRFTQSGFEVRSEIIELKGSQVLVIEATPSRF